MPRRVQIPIQSSPAALALALAVLALGACGGSSKSSSSSAGAGASTPRSGASTAPGAGGTAANRTYSLRECLERNGIKVPGNGSGGLLGPGGQLPAGVSAAQLRAALRKCGIGPLNIPAPKIQLKNLNKIALNSPAVKAALARYGACLREHGAPLPPPTAGSSFSLAGVNTHSPQFRAAVAACRRTAR
ncbi:MAG TPA: hypothetical protein VNZ05_05575 [Solirubrobacteraceae bacterium]|jgi:hypothetical protein|nr:hypothetical protein [Solirubrobacteraceae bacterium]